ncbi:hypothetical protein VTO73DRAFT_11795 [Trametes versicolor]
MSRSFDSYSTRRREGSGRRASRPSKWIDVVLHRFGCARKLEERAKQDRRSTVAGAVLWGAAVIANMFVAIAERGISETSLYGTPRCHASGDFPDEDGANGSRN